MPFLAVVLFVVAAALSVYKPRGLTGYGRRKRRERRGHSAKQRKLQLDGAA